MASNHSSSSSSLVSDSYDTPDTTAPSSPKPGVGNSNLLPSPFYPPSYSQREGVASKWETPSLPPQYPPLPSTSRSTEGALADKGSPDDGIIRDEALVRLTGKWPFNCEPSLPDLWSQVRLATGRCWLLGARADASHFAQGFLTPTRLFYVRNHGIVPKVSQADAEAWQFEVSG